MCHNYPESAIAQFPCILHEISVHILEMLSIYIFISLNTGMYLHTDQMLKIVNITCHCFTELCKYNKTSQETQECISCSVGFVQQIYAVLHQPFVVKLFLEHAMLCYVCMEPRCLSY